MRTSTAARLSVPLPGGGRRAVDFGDRPAFGRREDQGLLAAGGQPVIADAGEDRLGLALAQIEAFQGRALRGGVEVEDLPGLPRLKVRVVRGRLGEGQDPLLDAVEVDLHRRRFVRLGILGFVVLGLIALGLLVGFVGRLFLVAFTHQRRGDALAEHRQVDRPPGAHVHGRLREPLVDRPGVGRGEEIEVLAAGVKRWVHRVAQPVGDRLRPAGLQVVGVDSAIPGPTGQGVDDPAGIGGPGGARIDVLAGPEDRRRGDLLDLPALKVDPEQRRRIVGVGDFAAVGGPDGVLVRAGATGVIDLRLPLAVRRADAEPVLAPFIREPGDRAAVGRPGGPTVVDAGRLGQVAGVSLLGRHGDDLAAVLEHGAGAAGRNVGAADELRRALQVSRAQLGQVRGHADPQPRALRCGGVEQVEVARPLVDQPAPARGHVEDREVAEGGQLADGFRFGVVGEQVVLAVAVRAEVDRPTDPIRIEIVGTALRLRDQLDAVVVAVKNPDFRVGAAAVVLPLRRAVGQRGVGDLLAVGREAGLASVRDRQLGGHAAGQGDGEQLAVAVRERVPRRGEEDGLAVGGEAAGEVRRRMPGQPPRRPARHRHRDRRRCSPRTGR